MIASTKLTFGIVAPPGSPDVVARFEELAAHLGVTPKTFASYKDLVASVREGSSDIAWLAPVSYAWLAEAVNPIGSIRRQGATEYDASLFVLDSSALQSLRDVRQTKGLRAGWVDPWSAAGYVVPRLELARAGIVAMDVFVKETFLGSHARALDALVAGEVDVVATFAKARRDGVGLRALATWGPIPSDVIAVRRNLAPREFDAARDAFKAASADENGRERMRALFGGDELHDVGEGHERLRLLYESGVASGLFD